MNRTFPDNVKFRKSADPCLQKTLYNVLVAYGRHNQGVGYCQVSPQGKVTAASKDALTLFTGSLVNGACDFDTFPRWKSGETYA